MLAFEGIAQLSAEELAALGAFFSGLGSLIGACFAMRHQKKKSADDCESRVQAFIDGIKFERESDREEEEIRWSHL